MKNVIWKLLNFLRIGPFLQLALASSLKESGWFKSFITKTSLDKKGNPIPWLTYSFINFLTPRLQNSFTVLEFGTGNSTLWFSKKVKSIIAIEHNLDWYNFMLRRIPSNVAIQFVDMNSFQSYGMILEKTTDKFDIIINDGIFRNEIAKTCHNSLTENGVIIFDNLQVDDYREGVEYLLNLGFKKIDFIGMLPIVGYDNTTSIFYRPNNCLNI